MARHLRQAGVSVLEVNRPDRRACRIASRFGLVSVAGRWVWPPEILGGSRGSWCTGILGGPGAPLAELDLSPELARELGGDPIGL